MAGGKTVWFDSEACKIYVSVTKLEFYRLNVMPNEEQ